MVHKKIQVTGKVQGVFFRGSTREQAEKLGVRGTAQNLRDGSVEIFAEGEAPAVQALIDWCRTGPPRAVVEKVVIEEKPLKGYTDFHVIRF
ncbi:MAG: acylphosphatase [Chitinophagaceae bacterium]|nr:acylphosphatase [Chitinophagaceae bacterium]MCW5928978.1 acylphosphatase [Chitinophagaceae bacterium]